MTFSCISAVARRRLALAAVATLVLSSLAVLAGQAGARSAPSPVRTGQGYHLSGQDFVGYYVTASGTKVYCLSPRRATPRTVSLTPLPRYPGLSSSASFALAYALTTWGDARSARQAAVQSQVVNTIAGNSADVRRRADRLPASLRADVAAHVGQARTRRGPYALQLRAPTALTPGQTATGSVRVRSGSGHWLSGLPITLQHSRNVTTPSTVRTDRSGVAQFRYEVTDVGQVRIAATATNLSSTTIRSNHPKRGEQHMVTWSGRVRAHAVAGFAKDASGFDNSYACTTTCDGRPTTRLSACASSSRYASRIVYRIGRTTKNVDFPASPHTRRCRNATVLPRDGDQISAAWQFRTPHGWSKPVPAQGSFTVDCPAAPKVGVTMSYDCSHATLTIGLAQPGAGGSWTPLVNSSRHRMVLDLGGTLSKRLYAQHGAEAVFTTGFACGAHAALTMRGGVQRTNGAYNWGPTASIRTP